MADDNSCLFASVAYVLEGRDISKAPALRLVWLPLRDILGPCWLLAKEVARYIEQHPDTYTEVMLGKPNSEYVKWLLRPTSWGGLGDFCVYPFFTSYLFPFLCLFLSSGAIEVSVFSKLYQTEIALVDCQTARLDVFGRESDAVIFVFYALLTGSDGSYRERCYLVCQ